MAVNANLERIFPNLRDSDYKVTSPPTLMYNCMAWAVGITNRWWWPVVEEDCYWPEDVLFEETLAAFIAVFASLGYKMCDEDASEPGYEKIAIYTNTNGTPTPVARQLATGAWTSKIGEFEDIEHQSLSALEGRLYGKVIQIMKRTL